MVTGGEVGRGMGEVDQSDLGYAYADEHWVMYKTVESLFVYLKQIWHCMLITFEF